MFNLFSFRRFTQLIFLGLVCITSASFADDSPHRVMGVGSCAASNCHGGITAKTTGPILGNEFVTWYKHDRHAKSYLTLHSPESKRIAFHLGLGQAHEEKLCLGCHTTQASHTGERYRIDDGVGCESCHGASEKWLPAHTAQDATHESNVALGLVDLKNLATRSSVCASCHFGDKDKVITHRLYGAGHPRISFELDTYEAVMPRHWKDSSYRASKGWVAGQLSLASKNIELLQRHIGTHEIFPEFSQFACFSCHQSITQKGFMTRPRSESVGLPHINATHLETVTLILHAANHPQYNQWQDLLTTLHASTTQDERIALLGKLHTLLNPLNVSDLSITPQALRSSLRLYIKDHPGFDLQLAEQLVMATASLNQETKDINASDLKKLYALVKNAESYNPGRTAEALLKVLGSK